jgi:hypothetical protein
VHRIDAVHYGNPRLIDQDQLKRDANLGQVEAGYAVATGALLASALAKKHNRKNPNP